MSNEDCPILGDCSIILTHRTSYEPPTYLFPELLPKVASNSNSVSVWDGVADAVDVQNSFWRVANPLLLDYVSKSVECHVPNDVKPARTTVSQCSIASLIATNRLSSAGISADVLSVGGYSAEAIIEELDCYSSMNNLSDEESEALKSNIFINILAWMKLKEINYQRHPLACHLKKDAGVGQKRNREDSTEDHDILPSPSPWFTDTENTPITGKFISQREINFEKKIDLVEKLASLYERQIVSLTSRGQQTDYTVPKGAVNMTSPFSNLPSLKPIDSFDELLKGNKLSDLSEKFELRITSLFSPTESLTAPLSEGYFHFGRTEGVVTSLGGSVSIQIGLSRFTGSPEFISPHHFSFLVRRSDTSSAELWILNYGKNGVRVENHKWVLGEPLKLKVPAKLFITGDFFIEVNCCGKEVRIKHEIE